RSSDVNNFLVGQQNGINTTQSVGINYNALFSKNLKLNMSYFYNNGTNGTSSFLQRTYLLSSLGNQLYNQGDTGESGNSSHRFNARLEWSIDSANSIIYTPSFRYQKYDATSFFRASTSTPEQDTINLSGSDNESNSSGFNLSQNLMLRHRFK